MPEDKINYLESLRIRHLWVSYFGRIRPHAKSLF